jgi:hypothetical protein
VRSFINLRPRCLYQAGNSETASALSGISKKAKGIEQVRFAAGVGAGDEEAFPQRQLHLSEVSPVLKF